MIGRAVIVAVLMAAACGGARPLGPPVAMSVTALDGGELDLRAHRGEVVVLHLFTTWSLAAQADVAQLSELVQERADRDDVMVVGIALDEEGYVVVAPWRAASAVEYQIALATASVREGRSPLGAIEVVPTTVVLDRQGRPVARVAGPLARGQLAELVDRARR